MFGPIYAGHKLNTHGQRAFRLVFQIRRFLILYMAFFWFDRPVFQILGMNSVNILILLYNGITEPFETEHKRRMEYFNEGCLGLITYFLFFYSDYVPDEDLKYMCGWA